MQTNFNPSETEVVCLDSDISGKKEGLSGWNTNRYLRGNILSLSKNSLSLTARPVFQIMYQQSLLRKPCAQKYEIVLTTSLPTRE